LCAGASARQSFVWDRLAEHVDIRAARPVSLFEAAGHLEGDEATERVAAKEVRAPVDRTHIGEVVTGTRCNT
jgi:hypothetical protein